MCILFIYRNPEPTKDSYRLIIISNRDEFYARPAKSAHFWEDVPGCLGGTDMEPGREGGTWLGINVKNGRAGIILNLNGTPKSSEAKGRGFLVKEYLTSPKSTLSHANELHIFNQQTQSYNPYNLVMIDMRSCNVHYLSSVSGFPGPFTVNEKIIGIGNSDLNKPYKKVLAGKEKFEKIITRASTAEQDNLIQDLLKLLKQDERHLPDAELKKRSPEGYEELSSIFVKHKNNNYGTRTHTVILVNYECQVTFFEETMKSDGTWTRQTFTSQNDK